MSLKSKLQKKIRSYEDFPQKDILFRDILPVMSDVDLFESLSKEMCNLKVAEEAEAFIGIDARGFIFGTAMALQSKKPLIFARKPGKLPGDLISHSYDLEYGSNTLCLQKDAIKDFNKFCIVDDLLATGGTAASVESMLSENKKIVTGLAVVVELSFLEGRKKLKCPINSIIEY